jgi:protein LTV1
MGKQSRKFIDKKSAVKFKLMHRSQYDPLIADENAPKFVLVPVAGDLEKADELVHYEPSAGASEDEVLDAKYKRLAEQAQFGIYYDDDYDYMQHLKEVCVAGRLGQRHMPTHMPCD